MFRTRLISGIVLVALAILLVTKGGVLLYCVTAAISLIGMFELYRVMGIEKKAPGIAGYLAITVPHITVARQTDSDTMCLDLCMRAIVP